MSYRKRNRSTPSNGWPPYSDGLQLEVRKERIGVSRLARTLVALVRARRRLAHWPTLGQVRTMARFAGREPCSYRLDPRANFMPELEAEDASGRLGLCFTARLPYGIDEFVALPSGAGFSLL
ncbi:MAG: hypothetical protein ACRDPC_23920 [Solirubrobacteraceae bacterium]